MSDWQERITHETAPAIRAEHELRYRIAAPLILGGGTWADLGCGNGLAAAAALGGQRPPHAVLVDLEQEAVARAAEELEMADATVLAADLTNPSALGEIGAALLADGGRPVVTCFEVVEHLSSFLPLIEWAASLTREHGTTFVMSVPNDAFWAIENPHHLTSWGEGSFAELEQLLPAERTLLRQVALTGSAVVGWDRAAAAHELSVQVGGEAAVASHFIAAFGPLHEDLWRGALAVAADNLGQRRWERERESSVVLAERMAAEQKALIDAQEVLLSERRELRKQLQANTAAFDEWRVYIHELEGELGRPLSGRDRSGENDEGGPSA